ncbi:[protein-PII] uridylyltransferase [Thalassotalea profundi]|uniref:Bifunctional uridylyltransferase/uridylyl-removing enzyme n=1 Tax=Thalassotalea profundi TaxID=2036687 RepID=A0ABQ3IMN6_9GAMM|nr:[protein-PII] uridylyltransferase [Thalassotalea profundi]GHE88257.1 bifunctional uridylyltransferase/uridylyl-removing enzyme [Thalassotalea profundi]
MNIESELSSREALKESIQTLSEQLNECFLTHSIQMLMHERAKHFDQLLTNLWQQYQLNENNISLNAVGGYGRQALHPYSDIDLAIIYDGKLSANQQENLSLFLTKLWDFGVDIGHSVRSIKESVQAAKNDITIATNLLDIRKLIGSDLHSETIRDNLYQNKLWTSQSFYQAKIAEQTARHEKAQDTSLYLEPNLKNNPGGLRDAHTIMWIAQKHFSVENAHALRSTGFLQRDELAELNESYDFICRVRWALHSVTDSAQESLLFEHQADVAEFMHFGSGDNSQTAIERMMKQLYRAMTRVRELNQMISDSFKLDTLNERAKAKDTIIDEYFMVRNNLIEAQFEHVFINKQQVIRLFKLIADNKNIDGIAPQTLRLLRQTRRGLLGELQDYQGCREEFLAILTHPTGTQKALALMHRYSILASYFPQWRLIEGQMQFDMHNAYTVDEHSFKTLQIIDSFKRRKDKTSLAYSVCRSIKDELALKFAALFHHLSGKQAIDKNKLSAMQAKEIADLHQLKSSTKNRIHWLIANQDLLISAIQTQNINEPEEIKRLAQLIGSQEKLNALYILTMADMMATNENYFNDWHEYQLNQMYMFIRDALSQGLENIFAARQVIRENKQDAKKLLNELAINEEQVAAFWSVLPNNFFSHNTLHDIVSITETIAQQPTEQSVFAIENSEQNITSLVVYTLDRPKLFLDLFKTFSSSKLRVKDAQIMRTKNNYALEIFRLLDHDDEAIDDEYRLKSVIKRIEQTVENEFTPSTLSTPLSVRNFEHTPHIELLKTTRKNKALLKVNTLDDPSYIEQICQILAKHNFFIHSAKISTLGETTENVFLVSHADTDAEQQVIEHQKLVELLEKEIL